MKKFNFRLQPVLKLRRQQEDLKKRAVGLVLTEMNEYQRQAVEMATAVRQQRDNLKENLQGRVDLAWIARYNGYVTNMQQAIGKRIDSVAQLQRKLAGARQELAEASKQTKTIKKLEERQKRNYEARVKRLETGEMDEVGANLHIRRARD